MITGLLAAWTFLKANWKLALIVAAIVALGLLKLRWTAAGKTLERMAQAERNRRVKEQADAARDGALGESDPHERLRREFGSDRK